MGLFDSLFGRNEPVSMPDHTYDALAYNQTQLQQQMKQYQLQTEYQRQQAMYSAQQNWFQKRDYRNQTTASEISASEHRLLGMRVTTDPEEITLLLLQGYTQAHTNKDTYFLWEESTND